MKYTKEIKVGLLAIATILILILGVNFLKGINILNKGKDYLVEYNTIPGLMKGDPIQVNGFPVGRVKEIGLSKESVGRIYVIINITEDIDIPDDSRAVIRSADLLGEKYIHLQLGQSKTYHKAGDLLAGDIESDITNQIREELKPLTEKVQSMIVSVDTAITVISSVFTPTFKDNFEESITNIKQTLETFNIAARRMDELLQRQEPQIESIITGLSDNIVENEKDIRSIVENLSAITDSLSGVDWNKMATDFDSVATSLNSILQKIDSGEGSLGLMVSDPALYENLKRISETLDRITLELEANPKKYVPPIIQIGGK